MDVISIEASEWNISLNATYNLCPKDEKFGEITKLSSPDSGPKPASVLPPTLSLCSHTDQTLSSIKHPIEQTPFMTNINILTQNCVNGVNKHFYITIDETRAAMIVMDHI